MMTPERAKELQPIADRIIKIAELETVKPHELIFLLAYVFGGYTIYMDESQDFVSQIIFQDEVRKARAFFRKEREKESKRN